MPPAVACVEQDSCSGTQAANSSNCCEFRAIGVLTEETGMNIVWGVGTNEQCSLNMFHFGNRFIKLPHAGHHSVSRRLRIEAIAIGHFHLKLYPGVNTAKVLETAYKSRVQA